MADRQPVLENIGHGNQLDRAILDRESIHGSTGTTTTTTDKGHLDGVVLGSMDVRGRCSDERGSGGNCATLHQEVTAGGGHFCLLAHR